MIKELVANREEEEPWLESLAICPLLALLVCGPQMV